MRESGVPITERVLRIADRVVKFFPPEEADRARLEAALLAHLHASPVAGRVPVLLEIDENPDGLVLVTGWVEGRMKRWQEITSEEWRDLGALLASLHRALETARFPVPERLTSRLKSRDPVVERAILDGHLATIEDPSVRRNVECRRGLLGRSGARATRFPAGLESGEQPIHNDFNHFNYLFRDKAPPMILDWERAIRAPREYEVVRTLMHLPLVAPDPATAFLEGYRTEGTLDPESLSWAVQAMLFEQAVKHWPVDHWLAGRPDRLLESLDVLASLDQKAEDLEDFYA